MSNDIDDSVTQNESTEKDALDLYTVDASRARRRRARLTAHVPHDTAGVPPPTKRSRLQRLLIPALSILIFLTIVRLCGQAWRHRGRLFSASHSVDGGADPFDQWVDQKSACAWNAILNNIGPLTGAGDGLVIASPSRGETTDVPDYYYTWTRDSALVFSTLLPDFLPNCYLRTWDVSAPLCNGSRTGNPLIEPLLRDYIGSQIKIQALDTPSGDLWSGGLSEPKFHVDGSAFDGSWGRPQRDGPALRALSLIPYANYLLDRGWEADRHYVKSHLYNVEATRLPGSLIKNDLEEVANAWDRSGFDLWEEVDAHHLFTRLASLRALQAGARLAMLLSDDGAAQFYSLQAVRLARTLTQFWDAKSGAYHAMIPKDSKAIGRSGLDCAVPLSLIHFGGHGFEDRDANLSLVSSDSRMLATIRDFILSFSGMYSINAHRNWTEGWAVGRYPEDVYDGVGKSSGNPWFICTHAIAELLYNSRDELAAKDFIRIDDTALPFWRDLVPTSTVGSGHVWKKGSAEYAAVIRRLTEVADMYLDIQNRYNFTSLSEQVNRDTGEPQGARDLTWSYASFVSAARARRKG